MRRFTLLTFILFAVAGAFAQNISVADFYFAENDLTARTHGTSVVDQNGNICALIKVETTEKGLWSFDVGMLGVRQTEDQNAKHPAEIWVYVPFGVTWMTIQHEQLGKLNRYQFPCSIDKGCTYVMKLTTGKLKTYIEEETTEQYLVFQITPANVTLEVDGEIWPVSWEGVARKPVEMGTHVYQIHAQDYFPVSDSVTMTNPDSIMTVEVKLQPTKAQKYKPMKRKTFVTLNVAYSSAPQASFGFSVGQVKKFGWFVSVMTNGNFSGFSYAGDCDAQGYTSEGYLLAYSGEVSKMRFSVIGGGIMHLVGPLYARVGAGYGNRTLRWKTESGKWMRNTAFSTAGIDLSAGLQFHIEGFVISAEAVTTSFKTLEAKIGLGYAF